MKRLALIGFGEAGSILGADLVGAGCEVVTYDILLDAPESAEALRRRAGAAGAGVASRLEEAVRGAELVVSAVTAAAAGEVAEQAGRSLHAGQVYLDINSVSPVTRQHAAAAVEASGAAYVEAAVMAPVPPHRLAVPMLLGGRHAAAVAPALEALGMNARPFSERVGAASAVKLCRSVLIKGLEALTTEALFAARAAGVEHAVLEAMHRSFPHMGWLEQFPDYTISRVAEHGERRAAEMREAARTLEELGMTPRMAGATAESQQALVDAMREHGVDYRKDETFSWSALADALRDASR